MIPQSSKLLPLLAAAIALAALLAAAAPATAAEEPGDSISFLQTHHTRPAWYPFSVTAPLADPTTSAMMTIRELVEDHPDDFRLDMGAFSEPASGSETAYESNHARFFYRQGFKAMHMTPADFVNYGANGFGAKRRPPEFKDFMLSALDVTVQAARQMAIPASSLVEHDGRRVALVAAADQDEISAFPRWMADRISVPTREVLRAVIDDEEAPFDLLVVLSSFDRAENERLAEDFPEIALILEIHPGPPQAVQAANGAWIIPAADPWEFQRFRVGLAGGSVASVDGFQRIEWIPEGAWRAAHRHPLPGIGLSVPPAGRVAERLRVADELVNVEIHRNGDWLDLTDRDVVYAYQVSVDGEVLHVYRARQLLRAGFLPVDMLVLLDAERRVRRVDTNYLRWPVLSHQTRLGAAIAANYGKPVEEWTFPEEDTRNIGEHVELLMRALRNTAELDRRLYGDRGAQP